MRVFGTGLKYNKEGEDLYRKLSCLGHFLIQRVD